MDDYEMDIDYELDQEEAVGEWDLPDVDGVDAESQRELDAWRVLEGPSSSSSSGAAVPEVDTRQGSGGQQGIPRAQPAVTALGDVRPASSQDDSVQGLNASRAVEGGDGDSAPSPLHSEQGQRRLAEPASLVLRVPPTDSSFIPFTTSMGDRLFLRCEESNHNEHASSLPSSAASSLSSQREGMICGGDLDSYLSKPIDTLIAAYHKKMQDRAAKALHLMIPP